MEKDLLGCSLLIGGILLFYLLRFAAFPVIDVPIRYVMYILSFALTGAGFFIGVKGMKEERK